MTDVWVKLVQTLYKKSSYDGLSYRQLNSVISQWEIFKPIYKRGRVTNLGVSHLISEIKRRLDYYIYDDNSAAQRFYNLLERSLNKLSKLNRSIRVQLIRLMPDIYLTEYLLKDRLFKSDLYRIYYQSEKIIASKSELWLLKHNLPPHYNREFAELIRFLREYKVHIRR